MLALQTCRLMDDSHLCRRLLLSVVNAVPNMRADGGMNEMGMCGAFKPATITSTPLSGHGAGKPLSALPGFGPAAAAAAAARAAADKAAAASAASAGGSCSLTASDVVAAVSSSSPEPAQHLQVTAGFCIAEAVQPCHTCFQTHPVSQQQVGNPL